MHFEMIWLPAQLYWFFFSRISINLKQLFAIWKLVVPSITLLSAATSSLHSSFVSLLSSSLVYSNLRI